MRSVGLGATASTRIGCSFLFLGLAEGASFLFGGLVFVVGCSEETSMAGLDSPRVKNAEATRAAQMGIKAKRSHFFGVGLFFAEAVLVSCASLDGLLERFWERVSVFVEVDVFGSVVS